MSSFHEPASENWKNPAYRVTLYDPVSVLGAFFYASGDLSRNRGIAAALKLSERLKKYLCSSARVTAQRPVIVLIALESLYSWIRPPRSGAQFFPRCPSVLAVLALVTAYQFVNASPSKAWPWFREAYAEEHSDKNRLSTVTLLIKKRKLDEELKALITLKDASGKKILGQEKVRGWEINMTRLPGKYIVEIQAEGYLRGMARIKFTDRPMKYEIQLTPSRTPMGIQKYFPPEELVVTPIGPSVRIEQPTHDSEIYQKVIVRGKVSHSHMKVYVLIHPMETDFWLVQRPPSPPNGDGSWQTLCSFGTQNKGVGELFEVVAILSDEDLKEGQQLDQLPPSAIESDIIIVRRIY
jgi:hypothetical protein